MPGRHDPCPCGRGKKYKHCVLYETTAASGESERFDPLVALLRQRLPEIYAREAHFYLDWLISNALAAGRLDALPALADELADTAGEHLDTIIRVFDQLAYHGQLAVLAAAVRRAWPQVRDGGGYFDWAVSEFAERGMTIAMLDYCEHSASPNAAELEALGAYFDCTIVRTGGAALFEMIPAWLRFLEARELIDAAQRERTLTGLSSLVPTLIEFWDHFASDPELRRAATRWP